MSEWFGIETAPRDGTEIIVSQGCGTDLRFARWQTVQSGIRRGMSFWAARGTTHKLYPTHWHPLPEPPEAQ